MTFNQYQESASKTAIYPAKQALEYVVLGLVSEAGEIAGKLKKIIRDNGGVVTEENRAELLKELGDVQWYVAMVAKELGSDLESVATNNIKKLSARKEKGTLGGSGDNR